MNSAGIIAKYLATSFAIEKVVSVPRVISNCLPISTISISLVGSLSRSMSQFATWAAALIVGGGTAGVVQMSTVAARGVSTATTGGLGNFVVATGELIGSIVLSILAFVMPVVITVFVIILVIVVARWIHKKRQNNVDQSAY